MRTTTKKISEVRFFCCATYFFFDTPLLILSPKKAGVRQPFPILSLCSGTPENVGDPREDRLSNKDILARLYDKSYHDEVGELRAWTTAVTYIVFRLNIMRKYENSKGASHTIGLAWRRCHIFFVNSDDREGLHWFGLPRALSFQKDGWLRGYESPHLCDEVALHRGSLEDVDVILTHLPKGFIKEPLHIINADRSVRVPGTIPENG